MRKVSYIFKLYIFKALILSESVQKLHKEKIHNNNKKDGQKYYLPTLFAPHKQQQQKQIVISNFDILPWLSKLPLNICINIYVCVSVDTSICMYECLWIFINKQCCICINTYWHLLKNLHTHAYIYDLSSCRSKRVHKLQLAIIKYFYYSLILAGRLLLKKDHIYFWLE